MVRITAFALAALASSTLAAQELKYTPCQGVTDRLGIASVQVNDLPGASWR